MVERLPIIEATFPLEWIQRLDPRLKLLLSLLLMMLIFSTHNFVVLAVLSACLVAILAWQPPILSQYWRRLYFLRWLLLFTLLLHLFLTPGRTLFGLRILSYDGLLRGVMVDIQLGLALFVTLLFALTTSPEAVSWGMMKLLSPLRRFGVPVAELGGLLGLVFYFLPQVFQQGEPLVKRVKKQKGQGVATFLRQLARSVGEMILSLVGQADDLAGEIWRGKREFTTKEMSFRWRWVESLSLASGVVFVLGCWSL